MEDTTHENGVTDQLLFLVFIFFCKTTIVFDASKIEFFLVYA